MIKTVYERLLLAKKEGVSYEGRVSFPDLEPIDKALFLSSEDEREVKR